MIAGISFSCGNTITTAISSIFGQNWCMSRQTIATIPDSSFYDNCLISSCLKKVFTKTTKKHEPVITISKHIADVRPALEQLNKQSGAELSYAYLAAMEQSLPATGFRYVVIYRDDRPVLFCYFQLISLTSRNFSFEKEKSFVKGIFGFFLDLKKIKVLLSGNALRIDTAGYCYNESVIGKDEATEIAASAAERIADEESATAVILKDLPVSAKLNKWLTEMGYSTPWKDQVMILDIRPEWQNIVDYTAALSRKYRTRANKILAARDEITMQALGAEDIRQHEAAIHKLFTNVAESQPFILAQVGKNHFSKLKDVYLDKFEMTCFFHGKKLVAFYSAFVGDESYELYYVGFDYQANITYQLYFNLLFSGLERAMELGKQQLKLGRTSFDAKASLGAKPVDTNYFIKTANIPHVASRWFANYFSAMEDSKWKLRNPFK